MSENLENFTMPSSPADRKRIKDALHEIAGALQFIKDKRSFIKDVVEDISKSYDIPKKIVSKAATTLHKHNYDDVTQESTTFEIFYETLLNVDSDSADSEEE